MTKVVRNDHELAGRPGAGWSASTSPQRKKRGLTTSLIADRIWERVSCGFLLLIAAIEPCGDRLKRAGSGAG
ncbi:MAG TPA: hypothetical protein VEI04_08330 [Syntrophobacteria bacterium]|nr:hypothetical protein [Syntrophobacteria bacterium]